ncbi:IF2 family translation initiation factor [Mycolicibacterium psychrotolerans]|uniref:IF2 family translation initiation factor n=1 Tax=Mycolicibacterium psychrotolerans TaxID=216929 RepID=UPI003D664B58
MKITDVPFAILRLQYRAARVPLQIVENQVVARLDNESPTRLIYERSLGALDVTVGNLLNAPDIAERGAALADRSEALRLAAELDAEAGAEVREAGQEFKARQEEATKQRQNAQATKQKTVQESRQQAETRKREAAKNAADRVTAVKERVDKAASQLTAAVENAKQTERANITAAEKTVTKAAQAKLDDAADKRGEAAAIRKDADRLDELADVEKEKRQKARAAETN